MDDEETGFHTFNDVSLYVNLYRDCLRIKDKDNNSKAANFQS